MAGGGCSRRSPQTGWASPWGELTTTTPLSVLNANRNPAVTRYTIERELHDLLGITTVIWLPYGLIDDTDTDGHVDNVARFVQPATVLCQAAGRSAHDEARLRSNINRLRRARDAAGRQLTVIEVPWLPYPDLADRRPASYCNFYILNGGVIVPLVGAQSDDQALALLAEATGRTPVGVAGRAMAHGGGGAHCLVMPRFSLPETTKPRSPAT